MTTSWNLCFLTYTWYSHLCWYNIFLFYSFLLKFHHLRMISPTSPLFPTIFHCLSRYIPNFLDHIFHYCPHSRKCFENRTFIYHFELKSSRNYTNKDLLKIGPFCSLFEFKNWRIYTNANYLKLLFLNIYLILLLFLHSQLFFTVRPYS